MNPPQYQEPPTHAIASSTFEPMPMPEVIREEEEEEEDEEINYSLLIKGSLKLGGHLSWFKNSGEEMLTYNIGDQAFRCNSMKEFKPELKRFREVHGLVLLPENINLFKALDVEFVYFTFTGPNTPPNPLAFEFGTLINGFTYIMRKTLFKKFTKKFYSKK